MIIISIATSITWITGVITENLTLYIIAMILVLITLALTYTHPKEPTEFFKKRNGKIVDDERKQLIDQKSANMGLGISTIILLYIAVLLLTLRSTIPQYIPIAITIIIILIIQLLSYGIARIYYNRKY